MKEQSSIPISKVQRAGKFISTGAKIGTNYLKHYGKRVITGESSKEELHKDNASDIYNSLSELKGSALKVAQMLSMDKSVLPSAYQQQFSMAQYSAPPLSYPLVVRTFQKVLGKRPNEIFDEFSASAKNAASMGQVHQGKIGGKKYAVKVQYPGVGDSIKSDLALVKPIALRMFNLNPAEYEEFIQEVEARLMEEVDYELELKRSQELSQSCSFLEGLKFPVYYPDLSGSRILTMDWMQGKPLGESLKIAELSKEQGTRLGQSMWDFYHYQIHTLKALHADPHPGNFIVLDKGGLGIIDFGCVKVIPEDFYKDYFQLLDPGILQDSDKLHEVFQKLNFIYEDDSPSELEFFKMVFSEMVELLGRPFQDEYFDFSDKKYFDQLFALGERLSNMPELKKSKKARGVKDALYINRTYFGLYNLLHEMKANVRTASFLEPVLN